MEFTFKVEGIEVTIQMSLHAIKRLNERGIKNYQVFGAVVTLGGDILDMKSGHEFIIIDEDLRASYVFGLHASPSDITIHVITVVDTQDIWNKRGTKILRLH